MRFRRGTWGATVVPGIVPGVVPVGLVPVVAAHAAALILSLISVTAPLLASTLPFTATPLFIETDV